MLRSQAVAPRGIGKASPLPQRGAPLLIARPLLRCRATGPEQITPAPVAEPAAAAVPAGVPAAAALPLLPPETTAMYPMPPPGSYYQPIPGAQPGQQYYMAPPPGAYYPPPPTPYKEETASPGAPWWFWMGIGILGGVILTKVQEFMKNPKTPQQIMMEMAMKQMSGAMGAGGPGGAPGGSPFGGPPGGSPFGGPNAAANPFAAFASAAAASAGAPPQAPAFETTATPVGQSAPSGSSTAASSAAAMDGSSRKGDKFASRQSSREPNGAKSDADKGIDIVDPVVKEPSSSGNGASSSGGGSGGAKARSSFFADVTDVDASAAASSSGGAAGGAQESPESAGMMSQMMEQMLRNPEMQKMLYPYLPEPMRNPQSIEWMLNNPEVKKQMEQMFAQQNVMSPQMMEMMKNMDFNQDKVNRQFQELGLKPEDVISKVMANPELASGFSNPKVQAAIIDISGNPMNIVKYQNDPEVMKVLEKVTEIFQPQMNK